VQHAAEVVHMDEHPVEALRKKRDNSMRVALERLHGGDAGAFVSAGNSGAAMASAVMVLGNLTGVDRPAIALEIPSTKNPVILLDAGANVECAPLNLVQFAVMGDALARTVRGVRSPRIGILSNGEEDTKGTDTTRAAAQALRQMRLNFVGYIEGRDINAGTVDVAVTDGFTGNVVLKTMEGFARFMEFNLRGMFTANWRTKLGYILLRKQVEKLKHTLDYDAVGGAPLLGVNGVAIIAHGSSSAWAIQNAIRVAADAAARNVNGYIQEGLRSVPEMAVSSGAEKRRLKLWRRLQERFRASRDGHGPPPAVDDDAVGPAEPGPPTEEPPTNKGS
ncbi:MAG: phosphate acyltransferase PlsX, partial [Candidatus Binatia bacterium]